MGMSEAPERDLGAKSKEGEQGSAAHPVLWPFVFASWEHVLVLLLCFVCRPSPRLCWGRAHR